MRQPNPRPADNHVHTHWSWDTPDSSTMRRACDRAIAEGLPAIAFTEHLDFTVWHEDDAATSQGLIDRHVFYDGRYLSTELLPIQFVDYSRSRPMTADEADELFRVLFEASGWQP